MADVDPTPNVTAGIKTIQDTIDTLNGMMALRGADAPGLTGQINALHQQITNLQFLNLKTLVDAPANQQAIVDLNAASTTLSNEARNIATAATALKTAAQVVTAAAQLVTALKAFAV